MSDFSLLTRLWYRQNRRILPWRTTKNPYFIWLSEIMLQQTRVEQGLPYYLDFTESYPNIKDLANASEQEVLKKWQGLGYYSRARNLHQTAKHIAFELNGVFPNEFNAIKKLKGIGEYTAAAIASFAYDLPHAVVDGNVYRVLARYFNDPSPIDTQQGKKQFTAYANELIDKKHPAEHNQAIMELGALVCLPRNPLCEGCPLNETCLAKQNNTFAELPVKAKKIKIKPRYFHYLIDYQPGYLLEKRTNKDIWQNLFQFPLIEAENALTPHELTQVLANDFSATLIQDTPLDEVKHILTHQHIYASFWLVGFQVYNDSLIKIKSNEITEYPLPRVIDRFLENHDINKIQMT